jgi:signal transduction histidine kinase
MLNNSPVVPIWKIAERIFKAKPDTKTGTIRAVTITTSCQRRVLADNNIPSSLTEILGLIAGMLSRDLFHVEINRRLGALFRVSGIQMETLPHEPSLPTEAETAPEANRFPIAFIDGEYDLQFAFALPRLSERSRQAIFDAAAAILSDFAKVLAISGPVSLREFRNQSPAELPLIHDSANERMTGNEMAQRIPAASNRRVAGVYEPLHDAAAFAHRLRNPLTAIMSAGSQLASSDQSTFHPDDLMLAEMIEEAALAQERSIKRYLMAYGPLRITLRSLDLGVAIDALVQRHDSLNHCETEVITGTEPIRLTSDPELLDQILLEILRNAHEASPEGKVTLRWSAADRQALVFVKNHGEIVDGLDAVCRRPFRTGKPGHTGLGLNIARRYADYLGGAIRAMSRNDQTVVTVCLPLVLNDDFS